MASKNETPLVRAILQALGMRGVWAWRTNTGAFPLTYKGRNRFVRFGQPGTPDIIGVLDGGRFFGIEVKTADGKLRASQQRWHDKARSKGALVGVARGVGEALKLVVSWQLEAGRQERVT